MNRLGQMLSDVLSCLCFKGAGGNAGGNGLPGKRVSSFVRINSGSIKLF